MVAVIPARYSSVRLPGKMLLEIHDRPLILHTVGQAMKAASVDRVIVATDDQRIFDVVHAEGFEVVMTSSSHQSGSDRVAEVAETLPEGAIVVNVQGDEPLIDPDTIDRAVVATSDADIATTWEPIKSVEDLENPNIVKVVTNDAGFALYFSRSPVPFPREVAILHGGPQAALRNEPALLRHFKKHAGLYAYRREYLLRFARLPQTTLEKFEMLEQLRALEDGAKVKVVQAASPSIGVDTEEDLSRVRAIVEAGLLDSLRSR